MEYRAKTNGWRTLFVSWPFGLIAIISIITSQILEFFANPIGKLWIWCYVGGLFVAAIGILLIFYAKLPLYRQRRFLTFGSRALPETKRAYYRWGYRCVLFGIALLICLF